MELPERGGVCGKERSRLEGWGGDGEGWEVLENWGGVPPIIAPLTPCLSPPPETVRTATPFPMVSLFLVFTAFVISNIGHIRPQRTILAFVSGIFFILSGESKESTYGS